MSLRDSKLLNSLRGIGRSARRGVTRFLHPLRRSRAKRRLEGLAPVRRILVLCLGNICRSPYGEARLMELDKREGHLEVRSAGLMGWGNPPPETALRVAGTRGIELQEHASQLVSSQLVAWAELLVVMDPAQGRDLVREFGAPKDRILILGDLDSALPDRRGIPDPLNGDEALFMEVYERMDRCLENLFTLIRLGP